MSRVNFTTDDDGGVTVLVHPFLLPNALALRSACEYISISSPLLLFLSLSWISYRPAPFEKESGRLKSPFRYDDVIKSGILKRDRRGEEEGSVLSKHVTEQHVRVGEREKNPE